MAAGPKSRFALAASAGLAAVMASGQARAEGDNLLHGPHPFLTDSEVSLHVLVGEGLGDTLSGAKIGIDYGYKMSGGDMPLWLNLELNLQHAGCGPVPTGATCAETTGDVVETLAGVKWKLATPLPLVPYVKAAAGLVFGFPNGASDAAGFAVRAGGGANYFFFDWFGLGVEVGFSAGRLDYDATFTGSHTYALLDFGGGLEFQF
jgi:hypothetical protein